MDWLHPHCSPEDLNVLDFSLQMKQLQLSKQQTMQIWRTWIILIGLCGTVLHGQSLNSLHGTDTYVETSSESPELETAAVRPPGVDTGVTLLDAYASSVTLPPGEMMLFLSARS